jgi:hypothetical protein
MKNKYKISLLCFFSTVHAEKTDMMGGDGTQTYCGTVSPTSRDTCCKNLVNRIMDNKLDKINEKNKEACKNVFSKLKEHLCDERTDQHIEEGESEQ